jgi:uncharacterized repeat protein (TIGR03806 family)
VKRAAAVLLAAVVAVSGGASVVAPPEVNQALIESAALPAKLSAFGLFHGSAQGPANAMQPYSLQTPLFSDYATKERFILLPTGMQAVVGADGALAFPVGTVLVKSFGWSDVNGGRPVETRLLIHRASGWVALPYVWDADGRDATLKLAGARVPMTFTPPGGQRQTISYAVPNKNQCKECHSRGDAIVPIGPKAANLVLPATLNVRGKAAMFANPAALKRVMPRWDEPASGTLDARARAYLDVNCAHCHHPKGSASNSGLFLGADVTDPKMLGIGKRPVAAGRGSGGREFAIAPGQPDASILIYRLESTHPGIAMPEVGRSMVHREGVDLLRQWIASMDKDGQ